MPPNPSDPAVRDVVAAIDCAFPLDGATLSGTRVLFDSDGPGLTPDRPSSWREVAERINEVDSSLIGSLEPDDFRYYLPGLLTGCLLHLREGAPPYEGSVLFGLVWGNDDRYWDDRFLDRWGRLPPQQLDAVERAVDLLLPEPAPEHRERLYALLGPSDRTRAKETLDLLRIRQALGGD